MSKRRRLCTFLISQRQKTCVKHCYVDFSSWYDFWFAISAPTWKWWIIVYFNTHIHFQLTILKISLQTNHVVCLAKCETIWWLEWSCQHRDDFDTLLAHKILATQKSALVKYLKTTFSDHVRRLHAHNLRYQKQDRFWIGWFRLLTAQVDNSTCQLRKTISQTFGPVGDSSAE